MHKRFSEPALEIADVPIIPLIVVKFPASHLHHQRHDEKETVRSKTCKLEAKSFLALFRHENVIITFFGMSNFCNAQFQNYRDRNSDFYKNCDNTILNIYYICYIYII